MKKIFLLKLTNTDDREFDGYCIYIEANQHRDILGNLITESPNFVGFTNEIEKEIKAGNFESYLTKNELLDFFENENEYYMSKLQSNEAKDFKNEIMKKEHEYMKDHFELSDDELKMILENYPLDYEDRNIIAYIYEDASELAEEYISSCCPDVFKFLSEFSEYFDYECFGDDLCYRCENYLLLDSGRVVSYFL